MNIAIQATRIAAIFTLSGTFLGCASAGSEEWSSKHRDSAITHEQLPALGATGNLDVNIDRTELRDAAMQVIEQALKSPLPELRAHAIQALHYAERSQLEPAVLRGLADENRGVRFIATMSIGKFKLYNVAHLVRPLLDDASESVRAAAIYALHRCGEHVDLNPLSGMVVSDSPEVKANTALVLGELGNASAIPMLRRAAGRGMSRVHTVQAQIVDLQIAEAIVRLGDERELDVIRAALFAPGERAEVVALAAQICGRLDDRRAVPNLENLAMHEGRYELPPEVRMAATLALAQITNGEPRIAVPLEYATSSRPELRMQAALTLGAISSPASANALRQLLADSSPLVQVAAAAGALQQLNEPARAMLAQ